MEEKMSRWGIGSYVGPFLIVYGLITIILTTYFYPSFRVILLPYPYLLFLGIVLLIIGLPFWIISGVTVMQAYNANKLLTTGVFGLCRHPVYSAMMLFVAPGISLISNSWIMLTAPMLGYFLCKIFVKKEEKYLENVFGAEYIDYKNKIPAFVPIGRLLKK